MVHVATGQAPHMHPETRTQADVQALAPSLGGLWTSPPTEAPPTEAPPLAAQAARSPVASLSTFPVPRTGAARSAPCWPAGLRAQRPQSPRRGTSGAEQKGLRREPPDRPAHSAPRARRSVCLFPPRRQTLVLVASGPQDREPGTGPLRQGPRTSDTCLRHGHAPNLEGLPPPPPPWESSALPTEDRGRRPPEEGQARGAVRGKGGSRGDS